MQQSSEDKSEAIMLFSVLSMHALLVKRNKGGPHNPLMTQLRAQRLQLFPVVCDCKPTPYSRNHLGCSLCPSLHTFSSDSAPLFVCLFFTTVQLRHGYHHPSTHPPVTGQQWPDEDEELSKGSVTLHNCLMAAQLERVHGRTCQIIRAHTHRTKNK